MHTQICDTVGSQISPVMWLDFNSSVSFSNVIAVFRTGVCKGSFAFNELYYPAVFGHFLDPPKKHPRGAIFPTVDALRSESFRLIDWLTIS